MSEQELARPVKIAVKAEIEENEERDTVRPCFWIRLEVDRGLWERIAGLPEVRRRQHPVVNLLHGHLLRELDRLLWPETGTRPG